MRKYLKLLVGMCKLRMFLGVRKCLKLYMGVSDSALVSEFVQMCLKMYLCVYNYTKVTKPVRVFRYLSQQLGVLYSSQRFK